MCGRIGCRRAGGGRVSHNEVYAESEAPGEEFLSKLRRSHRPRERRLIGLSARRTFPNIGAGHVRIDGQDWMHGDKGCGDQGGNDAIFDNA